MSEKPATRRNGFNYVEFIERLLDDSDNRDNFPLDYRHNSCDRVQWPVIQLNQAAEKGDWGEVERIRAQLLSTLVGLENMDL
jgi:hypothetical protein